MSLIVLLPLFPPGDRDASQSHIRFPAIMLPNSHFPCILSAYPVSFRSVHEAEGAALAPGFAFHTNSF